MATEKVDFLNKLTEKALKYLESAEAFAKDNIPSFIEEILLYKVYEEGLDCVWGLFVIMLGILGLYLFIRKDKDGKRLVNSEAGVMIISVGLAPLVLGIIMFFDGLLDVIKIHIAPRMYLLEYFRDL